MEIGKRYRFELSTGTILIGTIADMDTEWLVIACHERHHNRDMTRDIRIAKKAILLCEPYSWGQADCIIRQGNRQ